MNRRELLAAAGLASTGAFLPTWTFARSTEFPMNAFLKDLGEFVAIDSKSRHAEGVSKMAQALKTRFESIGWHVETPSVGKLGNAVVATNKPGLKNYDIILCGHLDTVQPVGYAAKHPLKVVGDRAYGAGVADDKASLTALWWIAKGLPKFVNDKLNICVLLAVAEEVDEQAHVDFITEYGRRAPLAMVYEPGRPDGSFVKVRKGCTWMYVDFKGVAAHAGNNPQDGRSAVDAMCRAIPAIKALAGEHEGVTINAGVVKGGTVANTVAAEAQVIFDIRYLQDAHRDDVIAKAKALCKKGFGEGVTATVSVPSLGPAMGLIPASEDLMKVIDEAAGKVGLDKPNWLVVGGSSDGNYLASAGVAVVDAMGVCGGNLHNVEKEYIELKSVAGRIALGQKTLEILAASKK